VIAQWDGKPIKEPGVYAGIGIDTYHSPLICAPEPSVSHSMLHRLWSSSPAHFWATSRYNAERIDDDDDSKALVLGRAAHHVLVGEKFFADRYVIRPDTLRGEDGLKPWHGNRKACKDWLAKQTRTVLMPEQAERIKGMALSLGRYPLIAEGALNGLVEHSLFWRDAETRVWLKTRPDVIPADGHYVDLKTCRSTHYHALQKALEDYGYYAQAAMVFAGAQALGLPVESFTLIFIESDPPYCVRDVTLKDHDIALGARVNAAALKTFVKCWTEKHWPPPGNDFIGGYIELSDRARERIETRLKYELSEAA